MAKTMDSRENRVAAHLEKYGTLEPFEAWVKLGVYRLSASIYSLKKFGYRIDTKIVEVKNRFDETCRVAQYHLVKVGKLPVVKRGRPTKATKPAVVKPTPVSVVKEVKPVPTRTPLPAPPRTAHPIMRSMAPQSLMAPPASRAVPAAAASSQRQPNLSARADMDEDDYTGVNRTYPKPAVSRY